MRANIAILKKRLLSETKIYTKVLKQRIWPLQRYKTPKELILNMQESLTILQWIPVAGTLKDLNFVNFKKNGMFKPYQIVWDSSVILPALQDGDKVSVDTNAADGVILRTVTEIFWQQPV